MSRRSIIKRVLFFSAWLLAIAGVTTLLVAANRKHVEKTCRGIQVGIKGSGERFFVEESDIRNALQKNAGNLVGRPVSQLNTGELELMLEKNQWIRDAELYIDRNDVLHVFVEEREPVARVFTTTGKSFYIDSSGFRMPLLDKITARIPVITGFTPAVKWNAFDSAMLRQVKQVAGYVYNHPFWNAQCGQIDITPEGKFEIIPVIGDHVIRIGSAENIEEKLDRMMLFYKKVMARTGFSRYGVVDVQFSGQVVGIQKGTVSAVDSVQLQKNIRELIEKSNIQNLSAAMLPGEAAMPADNPSNPKPVNAGPVPVENPSPSRTNAAPANQARQPRAVMPARNG